MDGPVDLIVVGGGAVGLATAHAAAKRGSTALVLEKREFFHDETASGGTSRQFRLQYDDPAVSRLVLASRPLWAELQERTTEDLATRTGCLWFGDPHAPGAEGQIDAVLAVMTELDLPFDRLTAADVTRRFGFAGIPDWWTGFFQPDGAATNVKATLRAFHRAAAASGRVALRRGQEVVAIHTGDGGVRVETAAGDSFHGAKLVIAAGPETNAVLRLLGFELATTTWTMVSAWFRTREPASELPTWITFQAPRTGDPGLYYGFPELAWDRPGFVRVGVNHPAAVSAEPPSRREVDPRVVAQMGRWVGEHLPWLDPAPVDASACLCGLLTRSEQPGALARELVVDFAPGLRDVVVCATGWVFKIAPLLGEVCADLALDGRTAHDIAPGALHPDLWRAGALR
ncbi:FAD-dependent oxidoreductase [Amycolatopsis sp. NBC_01307]|uniref:FAD-dependent oxidoreductase n=1 Tax=Amycolatopsis sp. NBC_01307 TaxID=2903561 RepID=UPI002E12041D|nr:FAD-dependent oxidoreductase [Amycolatopsis sp. NBC_01307]